MQLPFERKPFRCLRYVTQDTKNFEEMLEIRLPDSAGGTILCAKGQPLIRSKEWRGDRAGITGGVAVSVLYISEDDSAVRCCEGWIPFQQTWDTPNAEKEGTLIVSPLLRSVEARMTGADKVMVTASLSLCANVLSQNTAQISQTEELPQDIHLLRRNYPVCVPVEAGEKAMSVDEELVLPPGKPEIERICHAALYPGSMEQKLMADKLVFRGSVVLKVLYMGVDGQLNCFESTLPVSQYVQMEKEYGNDAQVQLTTAVTDLETERMEDGRIRLKGGLVGQYVVYDRPVITLVEDAYSNQRDVTPMWEPLTLSQVLERKDRSETVECSFPVQARSVVGCDVLAAHPVATRQNGQTELRAEGTMQLLYYDGDDQLQCASVPWEWKTEEPSGEDVHTATAIKPTFSPQYSVSQESVKAQCAIAMQQSAYTDAGIPAVIGLEAEERSAAGKRRPGVILRRAGDDSLWQIAKECGSDVGAIQKANGLADEAPADKMLLIPVE